MKKAFKLLIFGTIIACAGGIASGCSEEADCSMTNRAMMQCNLYRVNPETGSVKRDTLSLTLTITALGTDSVIVNRLQDTKELSLPLRYTEDSTQLVFHYAGETGEPAATDDTLTIRHTNTPYFVSMDCGYQMKQALTGISYTHHVIDSVYLSNPEAGIYGKENIKLFFNR